MLLVIFLSVLSSNNCIDRTLVMHAYT